MANNVLKSYFSTRDVTPSTLILTFNTGLISTVTFNGLNKSTASNDIVIDFGNGIIRTYANLPSTGSYSYTYISLPGTYTVHVSASYATFTLKNNNAITNIAGVIPKSNNLQEFLYGCSNLESSGSDILESNSSITSLKGFFRNSGLKLIPPNMLDNCPNLKTASYLFSGCSNITTYPLDLFYNNAEVVDFSSVFERTKIARLYNNTFYYNPIVDDFSGLCSSCPTLKTVDSGVFRNNNIVTNFYFSFFGCHGITSSVPVIWNRNNVREYGGCYFDCTNAANYADIPADWK